MKRIIAILFILTLAATFCLSAQQQNESYLYPKTFFVYKVHNGEKGYRVDYVLQDSSIASFYAPFEWFQERNSVGRIIFANNDESFPYVSFFFKDGEVDHFRLYLIKNYNDVSWAPNSLSDKESEAFPSPDSKPKVSF